MADEQNTSQEQPSFSPTEQRALEQGWVPKDEFNGDEHKWVEAGEFLRRGELFQKIDHQNREIKEIKKSFEMYKAHAQKLADSAYDRALADLKAQKKAALEQGDADAVIDVDDEIDALKSKRAAANVEIQQESTPHPEFVAWVDQNSWYNTSGPMRAFADALGRDLAAQGKSPSEVLKEVAREVRSEFPNKFRNPNRDKASSVEAGDKSSSSSTKNEKVQLSDDETRIMNQLIRGGHITKEKYIADLKAIKERS